MADAILLKDIADSVVFFQRLFQITVALALGESFKQFVADESKNPTGSDHVFYDRLPSLLTFVAIIIPFFDGMNRYFYFIYIKNGSSLPQNYAAHLLFDSACFLTESAIFFIMSRALRVERVGSLANYITCLLIVDIVWSYFSLLPDHSRFLFIVLDIILLILMVATRTITTRRHEYYARLSVAIFISVINLAMLAIGYVVSWEYYFPKI